MRPWSVKTQWKERKLETHPVVIGGTYTNKINGMGTFRVTLPLTEKSLDLLEGTKMWIYYRNQPVFGGILLDPQIDRDNKTISFGGADWMSVLNKRTIDFQAADFTGAPIWRQDVESSLMVDRLLRCHTGVDINDTMFDSVNLIPSRTQYGWDLSGQKLGDAIKSIAKSCLCGTGDVGYACYTRDAVDPTTGMPGPNIYFEPLGGRVQPISLPLLGVKLNKGNVASVRTRVNLRGGLPTPFPAPIDPDFYDNVKIHSDLIEDSALWTLAGWAFTANPATINDYSFYRTVASTGGAIQTERCTYPAAGPMSLDWSIYDGATTTDTFLKYIELHWRIDYQWSNTNVAETIIYVYLATGAVWNANYRWFKIDWNGRMGGITFRELGVWRRVIIDVDKLMAAAGTSSGIVGAPDWHDVDLISVVVTTIDDTDASSCTVYIDGLAFHFNEVDIEKTAVEEAQIRGITEARVGDRRINDWVSAEPICENILDKLKYPSAHATAKLGYFDPDIKLNDVMQFYVEGRLWRLVVNTITTNFNKNGTSMTFKLGRWVPDKNDLVKAFQLLDDAKGEKSDGYKLMASYAERNCWEKCEVECEMDCLVTACQADSEIITAEGGCVTGTELDPCFAACQKYMQKSSNVDSSW